MHIEIKDISTLNYPAKMATTIIICLTIIAITVVISFTAFKIVNNNRIYKVQKEIRYYAESVQRNNQWWNDTWVEILELKHCLKELTQTKKSNEKRD